MIAQGTPEWHRMRLGKVTASRVPDIVARSNKNAFLKSRDNYKMELALERLTGNWDEGVKKSVAMQRGIDLEPFARNHYSFLKNVDVKECAFVDHPKIKMSGASPDGMMEKSGVEIKCPNSQTHFETLIKNKITSSRYITQIQWQQACCGWNWTDFVSFDDRFPLEHQMVIIRVERDDNAIKLLEEQVEEFLTEVDTVLEQLNERK